MKTLKWLAVMLMLGLPWAYAGVGKGSLAYLDDKMGILDVRLETSIDEFGAYTVVKEENEVLTTVIRVNEVTQLGDIPVQEITYTFLGKDLFLMRVYVDRKYAKPLRAGLIRLYGTPTLGFTNPDRTYWNGKKLTCSVIDKGASIELNYLSESLYLEYEALRKKFNWK